MNDHLKTVITWLGGFATLGALVLGFAWAFMAIVAYKPPSTVSEPATVASEVKRAPTTRVKVPPVKVYAGTAKTDLKLPPDALANPAEQVVSASKIKDTGRPQTVTTTVDTGTGEFRSYTRQDPLPWFALEGRGEVRLSAGYKYTRGLPRPAVRLSGGYDIVRIKALTAGAVAAVDSDGDAFVGIGIAYRF